MEHHTIPFDHGVVGVISDTHGLVRPEALTALEGSALIIHAGDIGSPDVVQKLEAIAPVVAIRGNIDRGAWAEALPETMIVEIGPHLLYVLHDVKTLDLNFQTAAFRAIISGHSHQPKLEEQNGVLFVNPGSAGPRRFKLPIAMARLHIDDQTLNAEIVRLDV